MNESISENSGLKKLHLNSLCIMCTHDNRHYENMPIYNILKILLPKNKNFQIKNSDIFHILLKT